jgi:hypothetical protein
MASSSSGVLESVDLVHPTVEPDGRTGRGDLGQITVVVMVPGPWPHSRRVMSNRKCGGRTPAEFAVMRTSRHRWLGRDMATQVDGNGGAGCRRGEQLFHQGA